MTIEHKIRDAPRDRAAAVQSVRDRWSDIEQGPPPDAGPARRGGGRLVVVAVALSLVVASAVLVWSAFGSSTSRTPVAPATPNTLTSGELVEPMTEREQAEVFAFRAVAAVGLMDPHGARSFGFTYPDDTTRTDEGWRVGFAAMNCEPAGDVFTCRGLTGEDPQNGHALTDAYVTVALDGGVWKVAAFEGNVLDDERARLVGYSLPERGEPSHWEFPAVGTWPGEGGLVTGYAAIALWVGPYPTDAKGSACEARAVAADGADLGSLQRWYEGAPDRSFERGGWIRSSELAHPPGGTTGVSITCHQYTGRAWAVTGADLERQDGEVVGVRIDLEWQGDEGITMAVECEAEVLTVSNELLWRRRGRAEPLWPQPEVDKYPYRAQVFIARPVDNPSGADHLGSYTCRSL